jgi:hypothetical protein
VKKLNMAKLQRLIDKTAALCISYRKPEYLQERRRVTMGIIQRLIDRFKKPPVEQSFILPLIAHKGEWVEAMECRTGHHNSAIGVTEFNRMIADAKAVTDCLTGTAVLKVRDDGGG